MVEIGPERMEVSEAKTRREETDNSLPAAVTVGSAAIAARLRQAIVDGKYADGERLPARPRAQALFLPPPGPRYRVLPPPRGVSGSPAPRGAGRARFARGLPESSAPESSTRAC